MPADNSRGSRPRAAIGGCDICEGRRAGTPWPAHTKCRAPGSPRVLRPTHPPGDRMKLYEFGPTRSIRARWTLQELGVPFESVVVRLPEDEHKRPEFLKLNPAGKLPVLVDDDFVLTESAAIVRYLAEKFPEKRLCPTALR